jgi:hypothetical protein
VLWLRGSDAQLNVAAAVARACGSTP